MKIAHVTATFPPYYGGTGAICEQNALGLAALGHDVTVFTAAGAQAPAGVRKQAGVQVVRLPVTYRFGNAPLLGDLFGPILESFDLIHLHYPFYFGGEAVWWKSLSGVPYVVTYHQDVRLRGALQWVAEWHHRTLGSWILARARRILATSLDYATHSRLAALPKAVQARIVEMPNGVDTLRFQVRDQGCARRALNFTGQPLILFVGGLDRAHYFKGIPVLLKAFAQLRAQDVGAAAKLVIVGDGDLRPSYQAQAHALGVAQHIEFAGHIEDARLPLYYTASDITVLPSTTEGEAFGVVLLEAMASGRPVVASNLPGVRSVVTEGRDGLLVQAGEVEHLAQSLRQLATHPVRSQQMGQAGRQKVERLYSWAPLIGRLQAYYTDVLAENMDQSPARWEEQVWSR